MKSDFFKIGPVIFVLLFFPKLYAFQEIELKAIPKVGPPVIIQNRIVYSINIVFKSAVSKDYWLYYERSTKKLIIDFYGVTISAPPLTIHGTDLIGDPEIWNIESSMALTGKRAQIRFSIKDGLHYEAFSSSDSTICLQLWRYLESSINKKRFRAVLVIPLIVTLMAAVIATVIIARE